MKRAFGIFVILLLGLSIFVEYDVARRSTLGRYSKSNLKKDSIKVAPATQSETFDEKFQNLSQEVSIANADETEEKLIEIAKTMSKKDVRELSEVMRNDDRSGDERSMALEILSRHQSVEALKELENFVGKYDPKPAMSGSREFESVLRAQAIEGIASFPQKDLAISSLHNLDPKVEETFLKDRIRRSIAGLQNEVEIPAKENDGSLRNLVE